MGVERQLANERTSTSRRLRASSLGPALEFLAKNWAILFPEINKVYKNKSFSLLFTVKYAIPL
jgi:hypothetical protein